MIKKPDSVRFATFEDADAIYEMLYEYAQTSPLIKQFPVDPATLMDDVLTGLKPWTPGRRLEGTHITGLCEANGKPAGGVNMVMDRWFWTADSMFLRMIWLYVHRGLGTQENLRCLEALAEFAEFCRASMEETIRAKGDMRPFILDASFVVGERVEAMERLWSSRFGQKAGAIFLSGLGALDVLKVGAGRT